MRFRFLLLVVIVLGCQSKTEELPVLSFKINAEGEKEYYTISYSDFTNQDGEVFTTEKIKDKIIITNFFFTRCPSICPPMRTELIKLAEAFSNADDVMLLSHTIDPKNDTISVLKNYAETTGIPSEKWQFLRSSEAHTKQKASQYMTNFKPNEDGTDFYHSSYVALVDRQQRIRGFYNILVAEDVLRLIEEVRILRE